MSTAEVIPFPEQQMNQAEPPKEVRVADCDNGYTKIANELLEAILSADLTVRQLKIVIAIIRKTYGFNKKTDHITNTQIAALTGIHHTHICKAKNELLDRKILVVNGREIGVNKVFSEWKNEISQNSQTLANSANKTLANSAKHSVPSQLNTKDTIKDNKEKEILKTHGSKQAAAVSEPAPSEIKIPHDAAIHEQRGKSLKWGTSEDLRCAEWLVDFRDRAFTAKGLAIPKKPSIAGWANDVRMMRMTDGKTHHEIGELFVWVCKTGRELEFCQSPAKLREKWDNLQLRRANSERGFSGSTKSMSNIAAAQMAARASGVTYDDNEPL